MAQGPLEQAFEHAFHGQRGGEIANGLVQDFEFGVAPLKPFVLSVVHARLSEERRSDS
jgi:hypothetical protein